VSELFLCAGSDHHPDARALTTPVFVAIRFADVVCFPLAAASCVALDAAGLGILLYMSDSHLVS
jgi:hypothetical protein